MILSTTKELRLHIPSNAIDEISSLQGILDNSEKDFLRDKLGDSLYNRLCEYYQTVSPDDFYMAVCNGENTQHPWMQLLLMAQRMVTYDAMSRFVYTQALSINGTGINVASSDDYGTASKDLLDKGVQGYKREAMVSLNQMLVMLEGWAKKMATPAPIADANSTEPPTTEPKDEEHKAIEEISLLWQEVLANSLADVFVLNEVEVGQKTDELLTALVDVEVVLKVGTCGNEEVVVEGIVLARLAR